MRRAAAVLLLLILAAPVPAQDEAQLRRLLQMLDDDSIDVRAASAAELSKLGKAMIPRLQAAMLDAGPELRDRLADVIRKIQERERLSALLPAPSLITIEAKNRPLADVLQQLAKQSRTPLDLRAVPKDAKVTLSLRKAPYWTALEEICRASGKVMPALGEDHVEFEAEPYVALPQKTTPLFHVTLQRIELTSNGTINQPDRFDHFAAIVDVAWERGARPWRVGGRIAELIDEMGDDVSAGDGDPTTLTVADDAIHVEIPLADPHGPGPQATRIARMKVEVTLDFPLRFVELKLPVADGKLPPPADCPEFSVHLLRFDKQEGVLGASLALMPGTQPADGDLIPDSIVLRDQAGVDHAGQVRADPPQQQENEIRLEVTFPDGAHGPWKEIVIKTPAEVHREKIDFDLKDIPLK